MGTEKNLVNQLQLGHPQQVTMDAAQDGKTVKVIGDLERMANGDVRVTFRTHPVGPIDVPIDDSMTDHTQLGAILLEAFRRAYPVKK